MIGSQFAGKGAIRMFPIPDLAGRTFNCEWVGNALEAVTGFVPNGTEWPVHWQNQAHPDDNTGMQDLWLQLCPGEKEVQDFRVEVMSD